MAVAAICLGLWLLLRPALLGAVWIAVAAVIVVRRLGRDRRTRHQLQARWEALTH